MPVEGLGAWLVDALREQEGCKVYVIAPIAGVIFSARIDTHTQ